MTRDKRKADAAARSWRYSPDLEAASELRQTDPGAYGSLPAATKVALGLYQNGKQAAKNAGINVSNPREQR